MHYHRALGQRAGLSERQVNELDQFETSDAYNELEKDVIRFSTAVTLHMHAEPDVMARLKQQLSDQELMELAMSVSLANLTNRMNEALAVELP
jgi:alkylhydroperoxidase family enzyme